MKARDGSNVSEYFQVISIIFLKKNHSLLHKNFLQEKTYERMAASSASDEVEYDPFYNYLDPIYRRLFEEGEKDGWKEGEQRRMNIFDSDFTSEEADKINQTYLGRRWRISYYLIKLSKGKPTISFPEFKKRIEELNSALLGSTKPLSRNREKLVARNEKRRGDYNYPRFLFWIGSSNAKVKTYDGGEETVSFTNDTNSISVLSIDDEFLDEILFSLGYNPSDVIKRVGIIKDVNLKNRRDSNPWVIRLPMTSEQLNRIVLESRSYDSMRDKLEQYGERKGNFFIHKLSDFYVSRGLAYNALNPESDEGKDLIDYGLSQLKFNQPNEDLSDFGVFNLLRHADLNVGFNSHDLQKFVDALNNFYQRNFRELNEKGGLSGVIADNYRQFCVCDRSFMYLKPGSPMVRDFCSARRIVYLTSVATAFTKYSYDIMYMREHDSSFILDNGSDHQICTIYDYVMSAGTIARTKREADIGDYNRHLDRVTFIDSAGFIETYSDILALYLTGSLILSTIAAENEDLGKGEKTIEVNNTKAVFDKRAVIFREFLEGSYENYLRKLYLLGLITLRDALENGGFKEAQEVYNFEVGVERFDSTLDGFRHAGRNDLIQALFLQYLAGRVVMLDIDDSAKRVLHAYGDTDRPVKIDRDVKTAKKAFSKAVFDEETESLQRMRSVPLEGQTSEIQYVINFSMLQREDRDPVDMSSKEEERIATRNALRMDPTNHTFYDGSCIVHAMWAAMYYMLNPNIRAASSIPSFPVTYSQQMMIYFSMVCATGRMLNIGEVMNLFRGYYESNYGILRKEEERAPYASKRPSFSVEFVDDDDDVPIQPPPKRANNILGNIVGSGKIRIPLSRVKRISTLNVRDIPKLFRGFMRK